MVKKGVFFSARSASVLEAARLLSFSSSKISSFSLYWSYIASNFEFLAYPLNSLSKFDVCFT